MVTLKDIANHVGISVSAASMALRNHDSIGEETKQRVWEAKKKLGYRLRSKPTGNIAFLLFDRGFDSIVYARFFQGIGAIAAKRQRQPIYLALEGKAFLEGEMPPVLQKRGVDGIIASGLYTEAVHRRLAALGIPIIALGVYQLGEEPWASCEVDVTGGLKKAIHALAEQNHRRIGLLVSAPEHLEYGQQIRDGFRRGLARFGVESGGIEGEGTGQPFEGKALAAGFRRLMAQPNPPTAVIIEKAHSAIYDECDLLKLRIPEDISLISLGKAAERMRPSLARVEASPEEMAQVAFEKLERLIEDPEHPRTREIFGMRIVPGDSIGPAPERGRSRRSR